MSDLAVLDSKKATQVVFGNKNLADDLLKMLIMELPEYKDSIQESLLNNDRVALANTLHKLHGGLRYVSTPALINRVGTLRSEIVRLNKSQLKQSLTLILQEIDKVIDAAAYQ